MIKQLVQVPPCPPDIVPQEGTPPETTNTCPSPPMGNVVKVLVADAYSMSPLRYEVRPVPPFVVGKVLLTSPEDKSTGEEEITPFMFE